MATNPYASIALKDEDNPYAKIAVQDQPAAPPEQPSLMSRAGKIGGDVLKGLGESGVSLMSTGDEFARKHLPAFLTNSNLGFGKPADLQHVHDLATPANTSQSIGKGIGDAAQFMIPGSAEEAAARMVPEVARPIARIGLSALSSGSVNKAQGGSFKEGAAAGGIGSGIGAGLKAAAPIVAETALGIPKAARAFGKTPGAAILNETRGIRPETIAESARGRLGELNPQLESAADAASRKPNPVRGLLTAPAENIRLHNAPDVEGRLSQPVRLTQVDRPGVPQLQAPSLSTPMAPGYQAEFPERLASGDSGIRPTDFGAHSGMGSAQYIGQIPGERGGIGQPQGILRREAPVGTGPIPSFLPNRSASLGPARTLIGDAMSQADRQNAAGLHSQLGNMQEFLGQRFGTDEPIPSSVTPRELLDLKRGFNEEHLRWNPELHDRALSTARQAYGALDKELDRTVPAAAGLNQRISSLIPVAQRGESISRNAPTLQRAIGRFGAHTGALTLGGIGAAGGYREGGLPGAVAGGVTGVLAPELIASPEGQMALARTLNKARNLRPAVGGALQLTRGGNQ